MASGISGSVNGSMRGLPRDDYGLVLSIDDDQDAVLGACCRWADADKFSECFCHDVKWNTDLWGNLNYLIREIGLKVVFRQSSELILCNA